MNDKFCIICGEKIPADCQSSRCICMKKECAAARRKKYKQDYDRRWNEEKTCVICGKKFLSTPNSVTETCSTKCRGIKASQTMTAKKIQVHRKRKKPNQELNDFAAEARAHGMSYGQWQVYQYYHGKVNAK